MTVQYIGNLTLGAALPGATAVATAGTTGINAPMANLLDQLNALLAYVPTSINLLDQIAQLNAMIAAIQAQITLGVPAPSLSLQLANVAALIAALQALIASMNAQLGVIANFQGLMATGGLHVYAYAGAVNGFGSAMGGQLSGGLPGGAPGDAVNALVLATSLTATWSAMSSVFAVTP